MREVTDPYKGKTYSLILESLTGDARKAYVEQPHPMIKIPGTGTAEYNTSLGRWVV